MLMTCLIQPLPNAFELYGIDFLIEHTSVGSGTPSYLVKILEINAEPAIELTGQRLRWILEDLFTSISVVCVEPFLNGKHEGGVQEGWRMGETHHNLIKCLEVDVRR